MGWYFTVLEITQICLQSLCNNIWWKRILDRDNSDTNNVRLLGLCTALANATDLADWLGVTHIGLYNFPAAQRPVPCQVHIQGFQGNIIVHEWLRWINHVMQQ